MLQTFADMMLRTSPDIVIGYNIFGFDFRFMADRALRIEAFGDPHLQGFEDVLQSGAWQSPRCRRTTDSSLLHRWAAATTTTATRTQREGHSLSDPAGRAALPQTLSRDSFIHVRRYHIGIVIQECRLFHT